MMMFLDGLHMPWAILKNLMKFNEFEGNTKYLKINDISRFLLELMMILMFLTGAGVLYDVLDCLIMLWESYV